MIHVTSALLINATPGRVWDLYADVPRSAEWAPLSRRCSTSAGRPASVRSSGSARGWPV